MGNDVKVHIIPKIGGSRQAPQAAQPAAIDGHPLHKLLLFLLGVEAVEYVTRQILKMPSFDIAMILQECEDTI